jgi:hypothetical protein
VRTNVWLYENEASDFVLVLRILRMHIGPSEFRVALCTEHRLNRVHPACHSTLVHLATIDVQHMLEQVGLVRATAILLATDITRNHIYQREQQ